MNIIVVGLGYVGLVAACGFAKSGYKVVGVEKDAYKLEQLRRGKIPFYERGLDEVFAEVTEEGRLFLTDNLVESLGKADIVIIAVGTPALPDGRVDISQVNDVCGAVASFASRPLTVVMKSTVPPGTGRMLCQRYFSQAKVPIAYVSNPEFLREGMALWDWYHPDRIVIGSESQEAAEKVMSLYDDIDAPKVCMDITSAEMVKYASNAFLATKISFINEIANLCEKVGADISMVAPAVGMDHRIGSSFLQAGLGYGGSCFPKDTKGLEYISSFNGYNFHLLKAVIEVNAKQRILAVRKVMQALGELLDRKIAVLGLSFKPGTDDIREAPAIDIIDQLLCEGARIKASDPMALENARTRFASVGSTGVGNDGVEFYADPYEACQGCEAVILATEWPQFIELDWKRVKQNMCPPYVLLDGRNALDKEAMLSYGFKYVGIGRP